jgi:hypothetical protein
MHVVHDLLDQQIVDRDECELGRVDGLVAELRDGAPPRIIRIEVGFVPLARRISRRFESFAERMHKRLGVRRSARYGIPWTSVIESTLRRVKVDVCAEETVAYDWERWLRAHVVEKIPGSSSDE